MAPCTCWLTALALAMQPLTALAPQLRSGTGTGTRGPATPAIAGEEPGTRLILTHGLTRVSHSDSSAPSPRPGASRVPAQGVRLRQEKRIAAAVRQAPPAAPGTLRASPRAPLLSAGALNTSPAGRNAPAVATRNTSARAPDPPAGSPHASHAQHAQHAQSAQRAQHAPHSPPGAPRVPPASPHFAVDGMRLRLETRIAPGVRESRRMPPGEPDPAARGLQLRPDALRPVAPREQDVAEELILTIRANGIPRGEFTLLRRPDGDFWLAAEDLPRLKFAPREQARRQVGAQPYFSIQGLGGTSLAYDEAELALSVVFPAHGLEGSVIDLSNRPPPVTVDEPGTSLILGYRLAARSGQDGGTQYVAEGDANVRVRGVLLRQEGRFDSDGDPRRMVRGRSQAIFDDRPNARRYVAGDSLSTAGAYGSAITGGGLLLRKLYDLTPDAITQPAATFRTTTTLPAEVEVAVDGTTISRTAVNPGPITVSNLLLNGGARTVRVTVIDANGRREVIEQPFLFTDSVLARGLHEYSYFVGKRSELRRDNSWQYLEPAWQGFHRYGLNDSITVSGGGEGSSEFANAGAGITLRHDRFGLFSADLLGSHDRQRGDGAAGWSARYTYFGPDGALVFGRRQFDAGFRTFTTSATQPFLRRETRLAASTRVWATSVSADLVRSEDAREVRDSGILRMATPLTRRVSLSAEYQRVRVNGRPDWAVNLFLRAQLDGPHWVGTVARTASGLRSVDLEAGKQLAQGEGFGFRIGTNYTRAQAAETASTFLSGNWNLRSTGLELFASQPLKGGGGTFGEAAVAGALVAVDGSFGLSRHVSDSFVLARLGVPLPGVDIYLNNQVQGRTDADGELLIPDVGAFGRQDVSLNDKQVPMQYNLAQRRRTVTPPYRSGTVVNFGGARVRAVAGMAWQLRDAGQRAPIASRAWDMRGPAGQLRIESGQAGDFYLENAPPGDYAGSVDIGGRLHACRLHVPDFAEAVHELQQGIICD